MYAVCGYVLNGHRTSCRGRTRVDGFDWWNWQRQIRFGLKLGFELAFVASRG